MLDLKSYFLSKHTDLKAGNISEVQANNLSAFENKWLKRVLSSNLPRHSKKEDRSIWRIRNRTVCCVGGLLDSGMETLAVVGTTLLLHALTGRKLYWVYCSLHRRSSNRWEWWLTKKSQAHLKALIIWSLCLEEWDNIALSVTE